MPPHMSGSATNGQSSGPPASAGVPGGGFKRGADDFDYNEQDAFKRPRTQTYPGVVSSAEVDAYRRQHEVSALVCILWVCMRVQLHITVMYCFGAATRCPSFHSQSTAFSFTRLTK